MSVVAQIFRYFRGALHPDINTSLSTGLNVHHEERQGLLTGRLAGKAAGDFDDFGLQGDFFWRPAFEAEF